MATQTAPNAVRDRLVKGLSYQQAGDLEKAQREYKKVLKKAPDNVDALHLLGVTYRQRGQARLAIDYIQQAIARNPNQAPFYANLARAMMDLDSDAQSLLAVCNKALSLNPREREARNIKGIALTKLKEFKEAEYIYQSLIVEFPDYVDAYHNFGKLLGEAKQDAHAINFFTKAIMLNPDNPMNYVLRARCRMNLQQYEPSQYELSEALEKFPGNSEVEHEAARLLFSMNESKKSIEYARKSLASDPKNFHKAVTLGVSLLMAGEKLESLQVMRKARKFAPTNKTVEWNMSLSYLANGDLKNGWAYHKARFEDPSCKVHRRTFDVPAWQGEDISDKTVLVWTDQGLGDALRSGTMLPEIIARAGKVKVELSEKGAKFMQHSFPEAEFRVSRMDKDFKATSNDYDVHANIGDLAEFFRPDIAAFKAAPCPVYTFEKDRARGYLERLKGHADKPIIGFSWRSKNLAPNRARFYLSAPGLAPVLQSRDAIFVNLQYSAIDKEIEFLKAHCGDKVNIFEDVDLFDDLLGAAALTACCDFVVSANTSVADMAGILNVPGIRFGQQEPTLLLGQKDPPWYPSITYMHPYVDRPCSDFVPEIIAEMDRQLEGWSPEQRNRRLEL